MNSPRVLVVGSHDNSGYSMHRYSDLLMQAYELKGYDVELARPKSFISRRFRHASLKKFFGYLEQFVFFPFEIRRRAGSVDYVHVADHSDAMYVLMLPNGAVRRVVTCHDLIAVHAARGQVPEQKVRVTGRLYQRWVVAGMKRASAIVAVSDVTSRDVERLIPDAVVTTIHNPLQMSLQSADSLGPEGRVHREKFALVVSSAGWRKRRWLALEAWVVMREAPQFADLTLIVVGPPFRKGEIEKLERLDSSLFGPPVGVTIVGGLSDLELAELYAGCEFLIQMSQYEGFCWPLLEANANGRLALCADEDILRETGGNWNVFTPVPLPDSFDVAEIAQALIDPGARARAKERALTFTVQRFADKLGALESANRGMNR